MQPQVLVGESMKRTLCKHKPFLLSRLLDKSQMQIRFRKLSSFYNFLDLSVVSGATYVSEGDLYYYELLCLPNFYFPVVVLCLSKKYRFALIRSCAVICQVLQHVVLCCLFVSFLKYCCQLSELLTSRLMV